MSSRVVRQGAAVTVAIATQQGVRHECDWYVYEIKKNGRALWLARGAPWPQQMQEWVYTACGWKPLVETERGVSITMRALMPAPRMAPSVYNEFGQLVHVLDDSSDDEE